MRVEVVAVGVAALRLGVIPPFFSYICCLISTFACARGLDWKKLFVATVYLVLLIIHGRELGMALDTFAETAPCTEQVHTLIQTGIKQKEVTMKKCSVKVHSSRVHKKTTRLQAVRPNAISYIAAP